MFKPVSNKVAFPKMEEGVLAFWQADGTFAKSLKKNEGRERYKFYDGPPFATGLPHYGHLLAGTIKDIVPRYQTMRGRYVERRFGWDTHGLPIEALAQEALGVAGAPEIKALGVDKFNEQCRSMVLKYVSEWRKTVTRMGRWVDFDNDYKTMNPDFMETIWWVFKQLWEQGRVYKSHRIMPYSWKLSTPLSNFEAGSNYKDVQDPTVTCRVKVESLSPRLASLLSRPEGHETGDEGRADVYLLIWTTTPWTLPENLAICAGASIDYVAVRDLTDDARPVYILAKARLSTIFKAGKNGGAGAPAPRPTYEVVAEFKGDALKGSEYEPLFPYFADKRAEGAFRVLNDDYVTTDDGVGLVHIAPAYGEDDFRVCKEAGITAFADPLDDACAFTDAVPEYAGRFCKDCDKDIIKRLKAEGKLVHQATIVHSYPFCDRTDTPLIYRAIDAWYVRVEDLHERLAANNATVHWTPDYVGEKRFGNWLKEARDWNISRNRFWGSCIPVWINDDDPDDMICVGSVKELEALSGEKVTDLHKHFVDKIVIRKDGKTYHRTPEVLDCWFESGSMPYAQQHYMGELKVESEKLKVEASTPPNSQLSTLNSQLSTVTDFFPADFIAEGLDQTRGWFYTLMILGTCLFDRSPYRNVIVNGLVLAEDGKKMSKRLKNYPDPNVMLDTYGADAIRLYMIYSPVVKAENLKFSETGVKQLMRDLLIPWWNAYSFFVTYANVDGFADPEVVYPESDNVLDRWIVSSMETLIGDVTAAMDNYDLQKSVRPFVKFIEDLTNWYIRRSRRRFWKSTNDGDKLAAYRTLRYVLVQLAKVAAPFTPFIAEEIYRNLKGAGDPESVHLCDFPTANAAARDVALEKRMADVQAVVELGRRLRADSDLKVRQPLSALMLAGGDVKGLEALIEDELNVKSVRYVADETELCDVTCKANFKTLGKKCGPKMKAVAAAIAGNAPGLAGLFGRGSGTPESPSVPIEGVEIVAEDVIVTRTPRAGMVVASAGAIVVGLETALTPALVAEGLAREFVSHVQAMRKEADFEVTQRIAVTVETDAEMRAALERHADYVRNETLAVELAFGAVDAAPVELNGHATKIKITTR
ncbi:MAG: isoleucine--tRNA ligase [Kiritimatiellae bacterium]|nr:isoleucine--tRNA ligase [Kiritimatiellia bacterium]